MKMFLIAAAAGLTGVAAQAADCLTANDLAAGIAVQTQNGRVYDVRTASTGSVVVTMARQAGADGLYSVMTFAKGVYMTRDVATERQTPPDLPEGQVMVGGNNGGVIDEVHSYPRSAPIPVAGQDWNGTVGLVRDQDGPSIGPQARIKAKLAANYQFLAERTVTLSGCPYRIIPVELALMVTPQSNATSGGEAMEWFDDAAGQAYLTRRLIYFPDLGFSVITKEGSDMDLAYMDSNGITGLSRAP